MTASTRPLSTASPLMLRISPIYGEGIRFLDIYVMLGLSLLLPMLRTGWNFLPVDK